MQNEQIRVAEFQPGITLRLCQGSQNLEFLRTTTATITTKKKTENKTTRCTAGDRKIKGRAFPLAGRTLWRLLWLNPSPKFGFILWIYYLPGRYSLGEGWHTYSFIHPIKILQMSHLLLSLPTWKSFKFAVAQCLNILKLEQPLHIAHRTL